MQTKSHTDKFLKAIKKQYPENLIERWKFILAERGKGSSYQKIGDKLKISRQRVRQIETFLNKKMYDFFLNN